MPVAPVFVADPGVPVLPVFPVGPVFPVLPVGPVLPIAEGDSKHPCIQLVVDPPASDHVVLGE